MGEKYLAASTRDLTSLPKAHLHVHLDGAMRLSTLQELATREGLPTPRIGRYGLFAAFGEAIGAVADAIRTEDDVARVVREVVEDAQADGVVWLELSVWPGFLRGRLGPPAEVLALLVDAGRRAIVDSSVNVGWMLAANRNRGPEEAVELAHQAADLAGSGVVSFGLDGDEAVFPPDDFAEAFSIAKHAGLLSTPHAGELVGPPSVLAALDVLGADRILHGVRAVEDPSLVRRLASAGACLDVCPSSNVLLGIVPDIGSHPLRALMRAGVACSLNADDPLLFGVGVVDEYTLARKRLRLTDDQLADLARASLNASAAPSAVVRGGIRRIDEWLAT